MLDNREGDAIKVAIPVNEDLFINLNAINYEIVDYYFQFKPTSINIESYFEKWCNLKTRYAIAILYKPYIECMLVTLPEFKLNEKEKTLFLNRQLEINKYMKGVLSKQKHG